MITASAHETKQQIHTDICHLRNTKPYADFKKTTTNPRQTLASQALNSKTLIPRDISQIKQYPIEANINPVLQEHHTISTTLHTYILEKWK